MPEQILAGRYRLVRQLGEGGMGQVWEARDEVLGRLVAVKVISLLSGGGSRGGEARARFLREARITAALQHLNIVTVHDLGETESEDGTTPFLVMELLRGEGLDAVMRRHPIALRDVARWGTQMCDALAEAHAAGILHRDIKPANIVISASGTVKVLDFGIARAADPSVTGGRLTQTGFIVGTPQYMAPEQARGFPEQRSDLYALGCVLFEMITGRLPFRAADTVSYLSAHLTQEPPAPSSVAAGIPSAWDEVVLTLLRKDPGQRYASAAAVSGALQRLGRGSGNTPTAVDHAETAGQDGARARPAEGSSPSPLPAAQASTTQGWRERSPEDLRPDPSGELNPSHRITITAEKKAVAVAFCPGRDRVVFALNDGTVVVADFLGREQFRLVHRSRWSEGANVAVSPDGTRLATVRTRDKSLRIWDAVTGSEVLRFDHEARAHRLVFSPDGNQIATVGGNWVRLWDARTGELLVKTRGRSRSTFEVAFSPDGRRLAVAGGEKVSIVDVASGGRLLDIAVEDAKVSLGGVAFSPDGNRLAVPVLIAKAATTGLYIVDSFSGSKLVEIPFGVSSVPYARLAFSPRGNWIAASPGRHALVWDADTGKLLLRATHSKFVHDMAFSPDGAMIATAAADRTVQIWNIARVPS